MPINRLLYANRGNSVTSGILRSVCRRTAINDRLLHYIPVQLNGNDGNITVIVVKA